MSRKHHYSHGASNILATVPSNMEIIAVYPELSSTIITHQQDIRLRRGDTLDIQVQVQNDYDPPEPYNIGNSILRWGVKQGFGDTESPGVIVGNEGLLIIKRSYNPHEIKLTNSAVGQAIIYIKKSDTIDLSFSPAAWELEITKPIEEFSLPEGSTVRLMFNSSIVRANNFNWNTLGIHAGDLFQAQNNKIIVTRVISNLDIEVDYQNWSSDPNSSFQAWRSNIKTIASGTFQILGDVVM